MATVIKPAITCSEADPQASSMAFSICGGCRSSLYSQENLEVEGVVSKFTQRSFLGPLSLSASSTIFILKSKLKDMATTYWTCVLLVTLPGDLMILITYMTALLCVSEHLYYIIHDFIALVAVQSSNVLLQLHTYLYRIFFCLWTNYWYFPEGPTYMYNCLSHQMQWSALVKYVGACNGYSYFLGQ